MAARPRSRGAERRTGEPPGPIQALELATRYLATRPRSRWEVERRLRRARATDEVVDAALEALVRLGLVDDLAFAHWWLDQRDRHAPRGQRLVEAELRQHGIGRAVIEALRDERAEAAASGHASAEEGGPAPDELPRTEEARARNALAGHLRGRPLPDDPRGLQRLGMFLVRRGFSPEIARLVLRVPAEEVDAADAESGDEPAARG